VGLPGSWAVFPACQGRTPRRMQPPLAYFSCGKTAVAFRRNSSLGIRNGHRFRGRCPSARTLARLRIAGRVAAPSQGSLPVGAVTPLPDGFRTLDDIPNFMNSSHDSLLRTSFPGRTVPTMLTHAHVFACGTGQF